MIRRFGASTLCLTALLLSASAAGAQERQSASLRFTSGEPGTSTGSDLAVDFRNPSDPAGKPPAIQTLVVRFHPGTRFDTGAVQQCKASDAQLMAQGAAACPPGSRVQQGTLITDSGAPPPLARLTENQLTNFNNQDELVGLAETTSPPTRVVSRSRVGADSVTIGFPALPGGPPDFLLGYKSLRIGGPPAGSGNRVGVRTPPVCPASGNWTNTLTFTYRDGVTQSQQTQTPCRAGQASLGRPCLASRVPIGRRRVGRIGLGASRARLLRLPVSAPRRRGRSLSFCVKRTAGRVTAALTAGGRAELVLSTAPRHGNRGVRPGVAAAKLRRAYPRSKRMAAGLWRAGPRSRLLFGVSKHRLRFVAVADERLLASPPSLRRALRRAGR